MSEEKKNLDKVINFRATEEMYKSLIKYLKQTGETISSFMRQATYDYLKFKEIMEENGYDKTKPMEEKEVKEKINAPPQAIMYCDSEHCEIDPRKMKAYLK